MPGQEANGNNLGTFFRSSMIMVCCVLIRITSMKRIGLDKSGYQVNSFLISQHTSNEYPQHMFRQEIRII